MSTEEPDGDLPVCSRCGAQCVQCAFEVKPAFPVCLNCVTDEELTGSFDWAGVGSVEPGDDQ